MMLMTTTTTIEKVVYHAHTVMKTNEACLFAWNLLNMCNKTINHVILGLAIVQQKEYDLLLLCFVLHFIFFSLYFIVIITQRPPLVNFFYDYFSSLLFQHFSCDVFCILLPSCIFHVESFIMWIAYTHASTQNVPLRVPYHKVISWIIAKNFVEGIDCIDCKLLKLKIINLQYFIYKM